MTVSDAVKDGRLVRSVRRGDNGKPNGIDPDIADIEWQRNTDHSKVPVSQPTKKTPPVAPRVAAPTAPAQPGKESVARNATPDISDFNVARTKNEAYKAELSRLEYEKAMGSLVDAEKVRKAAFTMARRVRDGMLNIPDRMAAELAGMTDSFSIHERLTQEIRQVLQELGDAEVAADQMVAHG